MLEIKFTNKIAVKPKWLFHGWEYFKMYFSIQNIMNFKIHKELVFTEAYNITESQDGIFLYQLTAFTFEGSRI